MINTELAESRGISERDRELIEMLQASTLMTVGYARATKSKKRLKLIYEVWLEQHKELQRLWGFEQDSNYIKFWEFPKCDCPIMDNQERYPSGHYVMNSECIIHGGKDGF